MRRIWTVAGREYLAMVRTKSFLISLLLTPVLVALSVLVVEWIGDDEPEGVRRAVVFDGTGRLYGSLERAARTRTAVGEGFTVELERGEGPAPDDGSRAALVERVERGELAAFAVLDPGLLDSGSGGDGRAPARIYAERPAFDPVAQWLRQEIRDQVQVLRITESGLDPNVVARVTAPVKVEGLSVKEARADAKGAATQVQIFIPMGVAMILMVTLMGTVQPGLTAVIEEKQQRIAEVLLGSVSPGALMLGKLLGLTAGSLTMTGAYFTAGYVAASIHGYADLVPASILTWVLAFGAVGAVAYGAMCLAIGSSCTEMKDAQGLFTPVMLSIFVPMMLMTKLLTDPMGSVSMWISFVPPFSAISMPLRLAVTATIPWWQPVIGLLGLVVFTGGVVWGAGRIFRVGILHQGKAPKVVEMLRWVAGR